MTVRRLLAATAVGAALMTVLFGVAALWSVDHAASAVVTMVAGQVTALVVAVVAIRAGRPPTGAGPHDIAVRVGRSGAALRRLAGIHVAVVAVLTVLGVVSGQWLVALVSGALAAQLGLLLAVVAGRFTDAAVSIALAAGDDPPTS